MLSYRQINGTFEDGSGSPLSGTATFTPSAIVYSAGAPVMQPDVPISAKITGGSLQSASGGVLQLLATDNAGVVPEGLSGFWYWTVQVTIGGVEQDPWSFFLPSGDSAIDLYSLANTPAGGGGGGFSNPMTQLGDLISGGSGGAAARLPGNPATTRKFLRSVGDGVSPGAPAFDTLQATDIPTVLSQVAPTVTALVDAATISVNAAVGNDFRVTLGGNRTMGAPSNPVDGQVITFLVTQPASGGPYTLTWNAAYSFGSGSPPVLSTVASATDLFMFKYRLADGKWLYTAQGGGSWQPWQFHVPVSGSDDSANLITALNNAASYAAAHAGYAEVVLDPGVYQCNAAPAIGGATAGNAILPLPVIADTAQKVVLRIKGATRWGADALAHWNQTVPEMPGTVLQTTRTDGTNDVANGPAYILGGPFNGYGAATSLFSNMLLILDGVRAVAPWNGTYGGFGFTGVAEVRVISAAFSAYAVVPSGTSYQQFATGGPTLNQWTTGLAMPDVNNNDLSDVLFWSCEGAAIGALLCDHTTVHGMRAIYTNAGIQAGSPSGSPAAHGIRVGKLSCEFSGSALVGLSPAKIDIGVIDGETITNFVYDPSDRLTGTAGVRINGTPGYGTFTVNGGGNYRLIALDIKPGLVSPPPTVPAASTDFPNLFYARAKVLITGGTGVAPTVDGMPVSVGTPFDVRSGGVINLAAYTVAPTWQWVLD